MRRYKIANAEKDIHEKGDKPTKVFRVDKYSNMSVSEIEKWMSKYNVKVREHFSDYYYFYTTENFIVHYPKLFGIVEIL